MGSLQEPRKEDGVVVDKPGPHDNYTCYRLQTAYQPPGPPPGPHMYGVVREACAQQNVKWPVECQVVEEKVQHVEDWPPYPEAFYEPSGTELRPQPVGDEMGRVVYQYYPTSAVNYFSRSCVGGNKYLNEDVRPPLEDENDTTLQFESRFECGNLGKAVQVSECYYELHLRADMYTSRHTQWFYFAVSNTRKDITYRFSVVNLTKGESLYNHGLRPLLYSSRESELHGVGWRRCATNIVYFKNHDSSDSPCYDSDDDGEDDAPSFTLTFNVTFPHDHDTVYIAHCYPYSYSDLQEHLLSIQNDSFRSTVCRQRVLCRSMAGNPVYLLTITGADHEEETKKKRAVVLTGRVHPGETPSSWIMKGVLDFLTADNPKAHELRSQFIFKVIPMLNPDGVIVGNHRCSLVGRDLNRQYKMVVKEMFPSIWHTKAMVRRLIDEHGVVMYGDFHAHSRKHNIFIYGCENRRNQDNHLREQIFPLLLHYNGGDKFSFRSCKFKVHRCKEGTARVVVWMMGVLHSYTMEASFGGVAEGPRAGTHYNIQDFISMGRQFCETLFEYFDPQPIKEKLRNKLWSRLIKKGSSADEPASIDFSETNSSSGESERGGGVSTPVRVRKKKVVRQPRRRTGGGRTSVAQVVEKVTSQISMDRSERRSRSLHHNRSGSCGSPVTERTVRQGLDGTADDTHIKPNHSTKKKLLERSPTSSSALDLHSGRTSLRPKHYKLEEALPTPCSAPPLRRSSHSLIRPPLPSPNSRDSQASSPTPSDKLPLTDNHLAYRLRQRDASHSDGGEGEVRECPDPRSYLDGATKSYMERMGELMATRLAISDTEDGGVSSWWEGEYGGRLLPPQPSVRRLEALEPVIAKTRLHDPRRPARPVRPQPSLYASVRTASVIHRGASHVHRSSLTRREKHSDHHFPRKKDKEYEKLIYFPHDIRGKETLGAPIYDGTQYNGSECDNLTWMRRHNGEVVDLLNDPLHNNNVPCHQYSSHPSQLDMGPCEDLHQDPGGEVAVTLIVPPPPRLVPVTKKTDDPGPVVLPRRGSSRRRTPITRSAGSRELDSDQLCADIATCDTLFLDTSAQETPELLAARNLKGKVKKKKSLGTGDDKEPEKIKDEPCSVSEERAGSSPGRPEGPRASQGGLPDPKAKKKIKIVIGKKTKSKVSKKSLPDKDT